MAIYGLWRLIAEFAPSAVRAVNEQNYYGRIVAIDAPWTMHKFMMYIRHKKRRGHLYGTFLQTIRLVSCGIKPVYVFDVGDVVYLDTEKYTTASTARVMKIKNQSPSLEETGDFGNDPKVYRRHACVTHVNIQESKDLLKLMGIPFVIAPGVADAQCAAMERAGKVHATASENFYTLLFGSSTLLRHLSLLGPFSWIEEYDLNKVLQGLQLSRKELIDLCILLGCVFAFPKQGVPYREALELIKEYRDIETILENINHRTRRYIPPLKDWRFKETRQLFFEPDVVDPDCLKLKWETPDEEGLIKFLCDDYTFDEDLVRTGTEKLQIAAHRIKFERLYT